MAEKRYYPKCAVYLEKLGSHLENLYFSNKYQVQLITLSDAEGKGTLFQVKEKYSEDWKKKLSQFTGLDTAATAKMIVDGEHLSIEVGGGKWIDKAAVASFATFVTFGFLLIPASIGAIKQRNLLAKILADIDSFIKSANTYHVNNTSDYSSEKCPKCNAPVKKEAKFCVNCGNEL